MKEFLRKKLAYLIPALITVCVGIIYFFFYETVSANTRVLETLNTNIVAALVTAVIFGLFLYHLESIRGVNERRLLQRLELRKRALECFEEVNKLIIEVRFYKTPTVITSQRFALASIKWLIFL